MKRTLMFTRLFVKRLLRKPSFVLILLLMPVLIFSYRLILEEDNQALRVGIVNESGEEPINDLVEKLCSEKGTIGFYIETSEEKLKKEVLNGHVDSGFVFRKGCYEALAIGEGKNTIALYSSNKSTIYYYALEKIYAELYHSLAYEFMQNNLASKDYYSLENAKTPEESAEFTRENFELYLNDGGVFTITIFDGDSTVQASAEELQSENNYLMKPVKGTLALFVLLAALSGAIYLVIDEKNGVYKTLGYGERPLVNMGVVFIPTFLGGLIAYASLLLSGLELNALKEAGIMLMYVVLLTVVVNLLRSIIPNEVVLCSLLPLIVVLSVLGCNVFMDLSTWIEAIKKIRLLLLPHYFLEVLRSIKGVIISLAIMVVCGAVEIVIDKFRMR